MAHVRVATALPYMPDLDPTASTKAFEVPEKTVQNSAARKACITEADVERALENVKERNFHDDSASPAPRRCRTLERVVQSGLFEGFFVLLIVVNTIVIALQVQYNGIDEGYKLGYAGSTHSS